MNSYKRKKEVTISIDEYEKLLMAEDLTHRQRFTIKRLEKELEIYKAKVSRFSKKTLDLLLNSGYSFKEIMIYYKEVK